MLQRTQLSFYTPVPIIPQVHNTFRLGLFLHLITKTSLPKVSLCVIWSLSWHHRSVFRRWSFQRPMGKNRQFNDWEKALPLFWYCLSRICFWRLGQGCLECSILHWWAKFWAFLFPKFLIFVHLRIKFYLWNYPQCTVGFKACLVSIYTFF